jgi:hypothetical protein
LNQFKIDQKRSLVKIRVSGDTLDIDYLNKLLKSLTDIFGYEEEAVEIPMINNNSRNNVNTCLTVGTTDLKEDMAV